MAGAPPLARLSMPPGCRMSPARFYQRRGPEMTEWFDETDSEDMTVRLAMDGVVAR